MRAPLPAALLVGLSLAAAQETCNVETPGVRLETDISGALDLATLHIIEPAAALGQNAVRVVQDDGEGGVAATFWFNDKKRIADGFAASFDFQISEGTTDGFAFVAQNDKINNIEGSIGGNLGFKNGLESYIAAGFDACNDRGQASACSKQTIFVEFKAPGSDSVTLASTVLPGNVNISDGAVHNARVSYLQDTLQVAVFLDNAATAVVVGNLPESAETLFGDKFAFFGFTASNFVVDPANIDITSFTLKNMEADARLSRTFSPAKTVFDGNSVQYSFVLVDSCDVPVNATVVAERGVTVDDINATLTENLADTDPKPNRLTPLVRSARIVNASDGSFNLFFDTPPSVVTTWNLEVRVNNVLAQDMPINNVLQTVPPDEKGLSPQTVITLCVVLALLVLFVMYMVRRLDRYRQQLKKHKEDIEFGKTKEEIDKIDATVSYSMNPMMAPLEEMKERLARNEEILENLRRGYGDALDSNYTIEQLVAKNEQLREEMARLRKEGELAEAANTAIAGPDRRVFSQGEKKEFDQQRG